MVVKRRRVQICHRSDNGQTLLRPGVLAKRDVQLQPAASTRVTIGFYPDGRIGEVFLGAAKSGTALDIATRDSAILLSFALQHGATVDRIRSAMTRDEMGRPEGAMGALLDRIAVTPPSPLGSSDAT